MPILTAHYNIAISSKCFAKWPENERPAFKFSTGDFIVEILLVFNEASWENVNENSMYYRFIDAIDICVERIEVDSPPDICVNMDGGRDVSGLGKYLEDKFNDFGEVAVVYYNRLVRFFRSELRMPLLAEIDFHHESIQNPRWSDGEGNFFPTTRICFKSRFPIPTIEGIDVAPFSPIVIADFRKFMDNVQSYSLVGEILSDAHGALIEGNFRRAVIELAIVSEIMAKRAFFSKDKLAGAAFDYLEKVSRPLSVAELVDKACFEAFDRSLKIDNRSAYDAIVNLFNCRNNVVHKGRLVYSAKINGNNYKKMEVDASTVKAWYFSVIAMEEWLCLFCPTV